MRNTSQRKAAASQSRSIQETDADVQQGHFELKHGKVIATIRRIDFTVETVEYKNLSFTVQKDPEVIDGEIKGGTKITCDKKENWSEFSENVD